MSSTADKQAVLLLGSYGRGNIGDDAFLLAALRLFKGHPLYINSANDELLPQAVQGKVTTIATSGGRDLLQKIRVFMKIRHIVYCGGDLWVELYGDRFPRQSLYKMVVVNIVARLFGKKVHYVGVGIGALHGWSLFLARLSARLAHGIVVREVRSARVLNLKKVQVLPDLVTTLAPSWTPAGPRQRKGKFVIGISLLYHLPNPKENFPKLVRTLAEGLSRLPSSHYKIVLFPMLASPAEEHDDVWASAQLEQALPGADISIFDGREIDDYVAALADVDVLIGARLHANIIAIMAGVPALGISYRPKVAQFFAMAGLTEYCLELEKLTPGKLEKTLHAIRHDHQAVQRDVLAARERIIAEQGGYQSFVKAYF
jgi:polysaccharide pyruvyl transferase WcaK-like protein